MSHFLTSTGSLQKSLFGSLLLGTLVALGTGCDTEAFCFQDCATTGTGTTGTAGTGGDGGGFITTTVSTGSFMQTGGGNEGGCAPSNGGVEICDHADNNCNGVVDDTGDDLTLPTTCGLCDFNCFTQPGNNWDPNTVMCAPSTNPGVDPGVCSGECALDYFDLDTDGTCEYFCQAAAANDALCNLQDDDCDGAIDEDVDLCTSITDCGKCGGTCNLAHATPACVHTGPNPLCTPADTGCQIASCDAGYIDLDGQAITGCEYQCTATGAEVCGDQVDNDCDGLVDAADDLSGDPAIGVVCYGDPDGVCATVAHQGITGCVNGQVTCTGMAVLQENDQLEICNNADDDCDGLVDDSATDIGGPCGQSNTFPCTFGTEQCVNGAKVCSGAINPGTETCNGVDDNCDGTIDRTNGMMPADSVGACGGYPPPPMGATSPCVNGTKSCTGGTIVCNGLVGPTAPLDTCGVDANCDGVLTNQPNKTNDPLNCGVCGNNCAAGKNAIYACSNSMCQFTACLPGFFDLNNDGTCEYACNFVSAQEACNNADDNCNGMVDENPTQPSKSQLCGISPSATRPECTTQVTLTCTAGSWVCGFPNGVCSGGCSAGDELCDGLDNDCDGFFNENVPDYNQPCASDDAAPVPGHGACRVLGNKLCASTTTTSCQLANMMPAAKADCATLPGGCTEACDGKDNDCDGLTDETFNNKGSSIVNGVNVGANNWVKPNVVKIAAGNLWMYQYEASRPKSTNVIPGSGNGYWTSAPPGETLDKTPACSVQNKIPWFNVTPLEAEQTCTQMGGRVCNQPEWFEACRINPPAGNDCQWGYGPYGANCRTSYTTHPTTYCNIAPSFDFTPDVMGQPATIGDQDGLLTTGFLRGTQTLVADPGCFADLRGVYGNPAAVAGSQVGEIFDLTGNLREITKLNATTYVMMGGAFNTQAEGGATCTFDFFATDEEFKFSDTGFRCCFTSDPRL